MSSDGSNSGSGSGSGSGGQALTNVQIFIEKGMLTDETILTEEGVALLNSLSRREVRQLLKIWHRLGRPEIPKVLFDAFAG